jgi:hypothetical protein
MDWAESRIRVIAEARPTYSYNVAIVVPNPVQPYQTYIAGKESKTRHLN